MQLYGIRDGEEIIINKDHIFPKSRGGTNDIDNLQPLCYVCNKYKGSSYPLTSEINVMEKSKSWKNISEIKIGEKVVSIYDDGN